jgi:hypothetical protein
VLVTIEAIAARARKSGCWGYGNTGMRTTASDAAVPAVPAVRPVHITRVPALTGSAGPPAGVRTSAVGYAAAAVAAVAVRQAPKSALADAGADDVDSDGEPTWSV